jgi:tetratricopeptide (TPR) repeat protein
MSVELIEDDEVDLQKKVEELNVQENVTVAEAAPEAEPAPPAKIEDVTPKYAPIEELDLDNIEPDAGRARDAKERGNKAFGKGMFTDALEFYAEALIFAPESDTEDRAVYHNNKAAAHMMLKQWEDVVYEATQAIHLKQGNTKAFARRAKAFEQQDRLSDALDDYKAVAAIDPTPANKRKVEETEKKVNERFDKQKDEMIGKLKDFGNTILGKFGMSVDQFQAVKDPETGSYSVSFGNKPDAGADAGAGQENKQ